MSVHGGEEEEVCVQEESREREGWCWLLVLVESWEVLLVVVVEGGRGGSF